MCDGNEKDTFDQDTTERTACKESSVDRTLSINSQDTDVDINLDSELISKDEVDLSKSTFYSTTFRTALVELTLSTQILCSRSVNGADRE